MTPRKASASRSLSRTSSATDAATRAGVRLLLVAFGVIFVGVPSLVLGLTSSGRMIHSSLSAASEVSEDYVKHSALHGYIQEMAKNAPLLNPRYL